MRALASSPPVSAHTVSDLNADNIFYFLIICTWNIYINIFKITSYYNSNYNIFHIKTPTIIKWHIKYSQKSSLYKQNNLLSQVSKNKKPFPHTNFSPTSVLHTNRKHQPSATIHRICVFTNAMLLLRKPGLRFIPLLGARLVPTTPLVPFPERK